MPGPSITFAMQLDQTTRKELEALLAQLNEGFLYIEHNEDGTHANITAISVTVVGTAHDDQIHLTNEIPGVLQFVVGNGSSNGLGNGLGEVAAFADLVCNSVSFTGLTSDAMRLRVFGPGGPLNVRLADESGYGDLRARQLIGNDGITAGPAFGIGSAPGSWVRIDRNINGNGAAGTLVLVTKSGTNYYLWVDDTGVVRIGTAPPEEDGTPSDTSGTIVGSQSARALKRILGINANYEGCLNTILDTPVFDFVYKDGRFHGEQFTGITTDDSPVFGKDAGRALNDITLFGYLINAIKAQQTQIEELRGQIAALRVK